MHTKFVQTDNVKTFLAAVDKAQDRGSREAGWVIAKGDRGTGKTRTLKWWALKHSAVYLRFLMNWDRRWLLEDLALELGLSPDERRRKDLYTKCRAAILQRRCVIVVDEIELLKVRGRLEIIETIRDLSDETETEVVLGGDEAGIGYVLKHSQFSSRGTAASIAEFKAATEADVRRMCDELSEVPIAPELVPEILRQSNGYMREIKNAIAAIERVGRCNPGTTVGLEHVAGERLVQPRLSLRGK